MQGPPGPGGNHSPTAQFSIPAAIDEGTQITFDGRASSDPDGDTLTYAWDFGDGAKANDAVVTRAYANNGSYTATLKVTDPSGAENVANASITVANAPPEVTTLKIPGGPVPAGLVPVEIALSDPGLHDQLTAWVNWGDGSSEQIQSGTISHRYDRAGPYLVHVHVHDADGAVAERDADHLLVVYTGYEVIDLGTLGGGTAVPLALNDKGQVVGYSTTASGEEHAFLWENGSIRDLNVSAARSRAQAITNSGKIAGITPGLFIEQAFLWDNGVTTLLGSAVDNEMVVIGMTASMVLTSTHDWEHAPGSAVWHNGVWQRVEGLGYGGYAVAMGMNGAGQIVGAAPVNEMAGQKTFHPFAWENGIMRDLGVLDDPPCGDTDNPNKRCGYAWAVDVNGNGDAVGYGSSNSHEEHALLWKRGSAVRDLGVGRAVAINTAGEVAGDAGWYGNGFFWRQGSITSLPSLGKNQTIVADLNDLSMVVGNSLTAENKTHVFVWTPGRPTLLDLGAGLSADEAAAVAVNARGDIIGFTCEQKNGAACWPSASSRALLWRVKP